MPSKAKSKGQIDDEASASDSDSDREGSDVSDQEKDSFIASEDSDDEEPKKQKNKKRKVIKDSDDESEDTSSKKKGVVVSNKKVDPASVPKKPTAPTSVVKDSEKKFFTMNFTNGILLRKFLEPVAHAVKNIRFALCKTPSFTGFRMEAHDAFFTLANKSRFECDIEPGQAIHGGPMTDDDINKYIFCVKAKAFMEALSASALKETTLSISRQHATQDYITFESINNENDVRTVQTCSTIKNDDVQSLDSIKIQLGFHVNVHMGTLKELSLNAKRCGALDLLFELEQAEDPVDSSIIHSKMSIGFTGDDTNGSHDFYVSAKKTSKIVDGKTVNQWEPLGGLTMTNQKSLTMEKKCSNAYDNSKLRLFLNHMECPWVLVHLGNNNTAQPLVLDCVIGGKNTKHTIIVAPKEGTS